MHKILFILMTYSLIANAEEQSLNLICDNIFIEGDAIEFSQNEKSLACKSSTPGWGKVPRNQQMAQIKVFLENRGYFQSSFENTNRKIVISPNKRSFIKKIQFKNAPKKFSRDKYRGVIDKPLTPDNLTEIKNWTKAKLSSIGFPCAQVQGAASYLNENLVIVIEPGDKVKITSIEREPLENLIEEQFQRYDAFHQGDLFNEDFLNLTSRRVTMAGLVSYTYFQHSCERPGTITQNFMPKKPNTIIYGIGGSSEELPILKLEWKNTELDPMGSQLFSSLYTSNREQRVEFGSEIYFFEKTPRFSLNPAIIVRRRDELIFESRETKAQVGFKYLQDLSAKRAIYRLVPKYSIENNVGGDLPEEIQLIQLASHIEITSNYFEYYQNSPREGFQLKFNTTSFESINNNFETSGQTFNWSGTYLINLNSFDPPNFILGFRFHYSTVVAQTIEDIPQTFRLYLGGQNNIRGFGRNVIKNDNKGFKTTSHAAIEGRFTSLLPYQLEPYLFYDIAKTSLESFHLSRGTYLSPGIGLRYESPIGSFRFSLARGRAQNFTDQQKGGWNSFFSYGREF